MRFVVLRHELPTSAVRAAHWDLMFEQSTGLATWAIETDLLAVANERHWQPMLALRLADHRLAYLDYEGPISGDRGHARRVERGEYMAVEQLPGRWLIRLTGERLRGMMTLTEVETVAQRWLLSFEPTA